MRAHIPYTSDLSTKYINYYHYFFIDEGKVLCGNVVHLYLYFAKFHVQKLHVQKLKENVHQIKLQVGCFSDTISV